MEPAVVHIHLPVGAVVSREQESLPLAVCGDGQTGIASASLGLKAFRDCRQAVACLVSAADGRVPSDDRPVQSCKDKNGPTGFAISSISENEIGRVPGIADDAGGRA